MKTSVAVLVGLMVLLPLMANAFPYGHRRPVHPVIPVPVYPIHPKGYGPVPVPYGGPYGGGLFGGPGLTLLGSAALLGSGVPAAQALGSLGLISLG